jgi:hypothetical protein
LDADVIVQSPPGEDVIQSLIAELDSSGKDIMFGDEDWHKNGNQGGEVNGGLILVRSCAWSKSWFASLLGVYHDRRSLCVLGDQPTTTAAPPHLVFACAFFLRALCVCIEGYCWQCRTQFSPHSYLADHCSKI